MDTYQDKSCKIIVSTDKNAIIYDLPEHSDGIWIPANMRNGTYTASLYQKTENRRYKRISELSFQVQMQDEWLPYQYPNEQVCYDDENPAILLAKTLNNGEPDAELYQKIKSYINETFLYDYIKAMQNDNPLIADIEETYESKTGICLDLATLAAAMLRSQGIPTRLVIGYAGQNLHAWTQSRINDEIILYDPTAEILTLPMPKGRGFLLPAKCIG